MARPSFLMLLFLFMALAAASCGEALSAQPAPTTPPPSFEDAKRTFGPDQFGTELVLEVMVKTGASHDMGMGANGRRRLVELIGGTFRGKGIKGKVLPGGTDRQTFRRDGLRELDARYELLTDDGALIFVHNKVLIDTTNRAVDEGRYAVSVVKLEAPEGPYAWLNKRILIGSLKSFRPEHPFVYLRFYAVQ